jgi:beta-lactamase superfamily II metal-dependent hydrolase
VKLTVFQSEKGDCLLLESAGGAGRILVDGGMRASYRTFVAPALGALAAGQGALDLVCVTHIDRDHIAGVLQLMDDIVAWRVHDFQRIHHNPRHPEPDSPRPPVVKQIWHNAFHELVADNAGEIGEMLAACAGILAGAPPEKAELVAIATEQREIASSIPEAIQLSRRVGPEQLGIPLNEAFGGKLAFVRDQEAPPAPIELDTLKLSVIGPFASDLEKLRREWNTWLEENQAALEKIQRRAERDADRLGTNDAAAVINLQLAQVEQLGDRSKVTAPNLASLMLLVEENGQTALLTGDGHSDDILKGLDFYQRRNEQGQLHVTVLKVQHHGGEHNMSPEFAARITADHYLFCGNGEHGNPDPRVVDRVIDARLGCGPGAATNPQARGKFKLWFNSSEGASKNRESQKHMRDLEAQVRARAAASGGRLEFTFLGGTEAAFELAI